jgi:hypothetical protein
MFETNLSSDTFDYCHFNEFRKLDGIERYSVMSSISTLALATACCYIDDRNHFNDVINFMTPRQQFMFKRRAEAIKQFSPNPYLVVDVQKMIMGILKQPDNVSSTLMTISEVVGINFIDGLEKQTDAEKQFSPSQFDNADTTPLFSLEKLKEEMKNRKAKDMEKLKALVEIGANKQRYYASDNKVTSLQTLAEQFPNFKAVIGQVTAACQVSILSNQPLSLPIINLQGPPGIGKTQFVKALSKALQLEFYSINAAAMTGRFELSGGNPQYGDADVGIIGQIMCYEAKSFQPILLIDELCMTKDNNYDSIIQPLYSFFDREQRKCFKENYLNLELDLSGTLIFTTTNDYNTLKPALKSRVVNIEIMPPTPAQMQFIVQNIYENCLLEMRLQHYFNTELSLKLLSKLCDLSPRTVIEVIRLAIGKACVRANKVQRIELIVEDLELSNVSQCVENTHPSHVEGNMH